MSKPVTVTLGRLAETAQAYVAEGRYASMSEVMRAGIRALEREQQALDSIYRAKVAEALADQREAVPLAKGFAEVRERIARDRDA
ncbi:hypothetical protein GCM10023219_31970 [Stakelama sediminis]|uniref:Antitoxin ParD1/3/4 n=1 Tax=Stakelama sediminis TaxID=463200 RepID=A0A840Z1P9_9SPHN|nr:type II toxin-antitoxin system ParD family antitoxin [Stakelama sediminis]MBB5719612.1 antitoxin ParD1/3/4 [Stakelama sediminis]